MTLPLEPGLVDPAQDVKFFWLVLDGTRRSGSEQELRAALSSGIVGATSLVWRAGWAEWRPAHSVAELAAAIVTLKRQGARERRDLRRSRPPPPDHSSRATELPPPAQHDPARDTLAPSSFGVLGPARRPAHLYSRQSAPPPPPQRPRSVMPTLSDESGVTSVTATLRPPGAVPPPARGVPVPALDSAPRIPAATPVPASGPRGRKLETPIPAVQPAQRNAAQPHSLSGLAAGRALAATLDVETRVPPEARRTPVDALPVATPAAPSEQAGELAAPSQAPTPSNRTVVVALSALSGSLLLALLGLSFGQQKKTASPNASASTGHVVSPSPSPLVSAQAGCQLSQPAARIAANIERGVPPYVAALAGGDGLALGFAASKTKGIGVRVNLGTLDVAPTFEEAGSEAVRGVVPLTRSGALNFFVDRDDSALRGAHTVDEIPPFTLGVSEAGFTRVVAGTTNVIWPLDHKAALTEPRTAPLSDSGYGVTFRRGGQSGSVLLGFVASDGSAKSELQEIPRAPQFLGTPAIASNEGKVLVAFAGRDAADAPWQVFASLSRPGAAPGAAEPLIATADGGAISPSVAAHVGGGWLLQWTEGAAGRYHVLVQAFTAELKPVARAVQVSPKGASAGQGVLAPFPGGAAALFIQTTAAHDELWGATLTCQ